MPASCRGRTGRSRAVCTVSGTDRMVSSDGVGRDVPRDRQQPGARRGPPGERWAARPARAGTSPGRGPRRRAARTGARGSGRRRPASPGRNRRARIPVTPGGGLGGGGDRGVVSAASHGIRLVSPRNPREPRAAARRPLGMRCEDCREAISARLDGELGPSESRRVDVHLAGCAACRRFEERAAAVTRAARTRVAETAPDLVDVVWPSLMPCRSTPRRLRAADGVGWCGGRPARAGRHRRHATVSGADDGPRLVGAASAHLAHESAAWSFALGVGFLWVACGGRARGLVPVVAAFVGGLALLSAADCSRARSAPTGWRPTSSPCFRARHAPRAAALLPARRRRTGRDPARRAHSAGRRRAAVARSGDPRRSGRVSGNRAGAADDHCDVTSLLPDEEAPPRWAGLLLSPARLLLGGVWIAAGADQDHRPGRVGARRPRLPAAAGARGPGTSARRCPRWRSCRAAARRRSDRAGRLPSPRRCCWRPSSPGSPRRGRAGCASTAAASAPAASWPRASTRPTGGSWRATSDLFVLAVLLAWRPDTPFGLDRVLRRSRPDDRGGPVMAGRPARRKRPPRPCGAAGRRRGSSRRWSSSCCSRAPSASASTAPTRPRPWSCPRAPPRPASRSGRRTRPRPSTSTSTSNARSAGPTSKPPGDTIDQLVASGAAKVIYHPLAYLDRFSSTQYSSRSSAASGCAAAAGVFVPFAKLLYANQPPENGDGPHRPEARRAGHPGGRQG